MTRPLLLAACAVVLAGCQPKACAPVTPDEVKQIPIIQALAAEHECIIASGSIETCKAEIKRVQTLADDGE